MYLFRHVEDIWENKDGMKEKYIGEVLSFNATSKKFMVHFITGDKAPLPWEYSVCDLIKILVD